jgi:hypothetical protein
MRTMSMNQKIVAAVAALIIVSILGAFGWGQFRKTSLGSEVRELTADSSKRLREALGVRADPALAGRPDAQAMLDAHAAAMSQHVARFETLDVARIRMVGYAAGEYLAATNGILRVQAATQKMHTELNEATRVLVAHFNTAGQRRGDWIKEALRRKERLDQANSEYRRSIETYENLLVNFSDTQSKLAQELGPAVMVDKALIARARKSAQDEAARAADAVARAKTLAVTR